MIWKTIHVFLKIMFAWIIRHDCWNFYNLVN